MKNSKDLSLGVERAIDDLGRLVIPKEMRDKLKFDKNQLVTMKMFKNHIQIEKSGVNCIFCDSTENIQTYKGQPICEVCLKDIGNINNK
ncbi:MAG: MraZ N-terminal domain-containing protein [Paraclostridium sp.]